MNYKEVCPHCGAVVSAYIHCLNLPLVMALGKLVDFYRDNGCAANLQRDLDLTKNQYNNFQKLQYFDLVKKVPGGWLPTVDGIDFMEGESMAFNRVATFKGKVINTNHPAWADHNDKPKLISLWDIEDGFYKKRFEYQREKSSQMSIDALIESEELTGFDKEADRFFESTRGCG